MQPRQKDFIPGLDGLRAVAVVAVILFHAEISGWAPGGFLGVDIFFTLSGFLITSLLLRELDNAKSINFAHFYERRFLRLVPVMLLVVMASALASLLWAPDARQHLQGDIPAALFYVSNWWQIHAEQSYFETFGRPPLLQHFWSLAIEEQFYVIWPVLLLLAWKLAGRFAVLGLALVLALASTAWMAYIALEQGIPGDASVNRVYLGTDTHAAGLLIGACLASLWNPWRPAKGATISQTHPWFKDMAGLVSIAGILLAFAWVNEANEWLYVGGFTVIGLLSCLLIVSACDARTLLGRTLAHPLFTYLGSRSYGLYLWHWPVFNLLRPSVELPDQPLLAFAIRCVVTVVITEVSYVCIEQPVRHRPIRTWQFKGWTIAGTSAVASVIVFALLFTGSAIHPPRGDDGQEELASRSDEHADEASVVSMLCNAPSPGIKPICLSVGPEADDPDSMPDAAPPKGAESAQAEQGVAPPDKDLAMTAIGDSVLLGSQHHLTRQLPQVRIDAKVGRQASEALNRIRELKRQGQLAQTVLIHLGTNGYLHERHIRSIMSELVDRQKVIFMNVHANRRWIEGNNQIIDRLGSQYPNVKVINWRSSDMVHPDYFAADGVHLNAKGIRAYTSLIMQAGQDGKAPALPPEGNLPAVTMPVAAARASSAVAQAVVPPVSDARSAAPIGAASSPMETQQAPARIVYPSMRLSPGGDRSDDSSAGTAPKSEEG